MMPARYRAGRCVPVYWTPPIRYDVAIGVLLNITVQVT